MNIRPAIGGQLDFRRLAEMHRPVTDAAMRAEVIRLAATGLTAQDIHVALRLDLAMVREILAGAKP